MDKDAKVDREMLGCTCTTRHEGGDLKRICVESARRLSPFAPHTSKSEEQEERKTQVEAALWDVRARIYKHSVRFMVHLVALALLGMLHSLYVNPSMPQLVQFIFMSCVYVSHHLVCTDKLQLNGTNLRRFYTLFYASFVCYLSWPTWVKMIVGQASFRALTLVLE